MKKWIEGFAVAASLGVSEAALAKKHELKPLVVAISGQTQPKEPTGSKEKNLADKILNIPQNDSPSQKEVEPPPASLTTETSLIPLTEPPPNGEAGNWLALDPDCEPRPELIALEKNIQTVEEFIRNGEDEIERIKHTLIEMRSLTEPESLRLETQQYRQLLKKLNHELVRARHRLTKLKKALRHDMQILKK